MSNRKPWEGTMKHLVRQLFVLALAITLIGWLVSQWRYITGDGDGHPHWNAGAPRA